MLPALLAPGGGADGLESMAAPTRPAVTSEAQTLSQPLALPANPGAIREAHSDGGYWYWQEQETQ